MSYSHCYYFNPFATGRDDLGTGVFLEDLQGLSEFLHYEGKPITHWPDGVTIRLHGDELDDVPACIEHWQFFSDRLKVAVEEAGFTGTTFHKVITIPARPGPTPKYWYSHPVTIPGAIDLDESTCTQFDLEGNSEPKLVVIKSVLKGSVIDGVDLFRIPECSPRQFCSARFKEFFEAGGFTGIGFQRVRLELLSNVVDAA